MKNTPSSSDYKTLLADISRLYEGARQTILHLPLSHDDVPVTTDRHDGRGNTLALRDLTL